jgi:2,4-dichlorophenol 6-monooxygenase
MQVYKITRWSVEAVLASSSRVGRVFLVGDGTHRHPAWAPAHVGRRARRSSDRAHRSAILRAMRAQSMEFSELNVEFGYEYDSAAVVPDGSPNQVPLDDTRVYERSTRPGSALPHAWIDDEDGNRRACATSWRPAGSCSWPARTARAGVRLPGELAAAADVSIDAIRIGHLDGDLYDSRCMWLRRRGISAGGAVLVRPDRFVAWRSIGGCDDPRAALAGALSRVLSRPVEARVAVGAS